MVFYKCLSAGAQNEEFPAAQNEEFPAAKKEEFPAARNEEFFDACGNEMTQVIVTDLGRFNRVQFQTSTDSPAPLFIYVSKVFSYDLPP